MFIVGVALPLCAAGTQAGATSIPHGSLELVAENQSIAPNHNFSLGLKFQLDKGWHVYWINPGDSGEPTRVTWQLPAGITAGPIEWPAPKRLESGSIVDYGYEDSVLLLVPMHVEQTFSAQPSVRINASAKLLICSHEMCLPGKADLSLALPIKQQAPVADPRSTDLFTAARKSLPKPTPANWKFIVSDEKDSFVLSGKVGHQVKQAVFFPLTDLQIANAAPQSLQSTAAGFRLTLHKSEQLLKPIQRVKGVLALSGNQAYWIDAPVTKGVASRSISISRFKRKIVTTISAGGSNP